MKKRDIAGIVLIAIAIAIALLLGTLGWFAIGFGTKTDCTDSYSCTTTGCTPCATTARWIDVGGVTQLALVGAGVVALVQAARARLRVPVLAVATALLATSVLTVVGTTWLADRSYCRPGTTGYASSYCSVDD